MNFGDKVCVKCKQSKPLSEFGIRSKNHPWYRSVCKVCVAKDQQNIRLDRKNSGLCIRCNHEIGSERIGKTMCRTCCLHDLKRHRENKRKAVEYLGGECSMCGLKMDIVAIYDLHHMGEKSEGYNASTLFGKAWKDIQSELDKCVLLCANCHRILHAIEDEVNSH